MEPTSLQDYLEQRFADVDCVTDVMIQQAKQEWRKIYLSQYSKQYREQYVQISFRIPKKLYKQYQENAKKENTTVTKFLKNKVLNPQNTLELTVIRILVLMLIDTVEEAMQERRVLVSSEILMQLEVIYEHIQ